MNHSDSMYCYMNYITWTWVNSHKFPIINLCSQLTLQQAGLEVQSGAHLDAKDSGGHSALSLAAQQGRSRGERQLRAIWSQGYPSKGGTNEVSFTPRDVQDQECSNQKAAIELFLVYLYFSVWFVIWSICWWQFLFWFFMSVLSWLGAMGFPFDTQMSGQIGPADEFLGHANQAVTLIHWSTVYGLWDNNWIDQSRLLGCRCVGDLSWELIWEWWSVICDMILVVTLPC